MEENRWWGDNRKEVPIFLSIIAKTSHSHLIWLTCYTYSKNKPPIILDQPSLFLLMCWSLFSFFYIVICFIVYVYIVIIIFICFYIPTLFLCLLVEKLNRIIICFTISVRTKRTLREPMHGRRRHLFFTSFSTNNLTPYPADRFLLFLQKLESMLHASPCSRVKRRAYKFLGQQVERYLTVKLICCNLALNTLMYFLIVFKY